MHGFKYLRSSAPSENSTAYDENNFSFNNNSSYIVIFIKLSCVNNLKLKYGSMELIDLILNFNKI